MIEIKLQVINGNLEIIKYDVLYPFSLHIYERTPKRIYWNVVSLTCKKNQGSFRLYYARKVDISRLQHDGQSKITVGGVLTNKKNVKLDDDTKALQYLFFQKHLLIYVDEKNPNSYMNDKKNILPAFLINNIANAQNSIHFWLEYEDDNINIKNEEINLHLYLEYE